MEAPEGVGISPSWAQFYMHISGRALELTSALRQSFCFLGRVLSQILINIAIAVDPRVWAEFKGYGVNAVTVSSDRLASAS